MQNFVKLNTYLRSDFFFDYYLPCLLQFSKWETSQNVKWLKKEREINWWNHPILEQLKSWWLIFGIFQYISKINFNTNTFKLFIQISIILLMVLWVLFYFIKIFPVQSSSLIMSCSVCLHRIRKIYIYKVIGYKKFWLYIIYLLIKQSHQNISFNSPNFYFNGHYHEGF